MTEEIIFNPREYNDNLGTMLCFHKKYDLGDKVDNFNDEDCYSWQDIEIELNKSKSRELLTFCPISNWSRLTQGSGWVFRDWPFFENFDFVDLPAIYLNEPMQYAMLVQSKKKLGVYL